LKEFETFTRAADEHVAVFEHRFENAPRRAARDEELAELVEVIAVVELLERLEDFVFAQARIFERALLEPIVLDEIGFVLLREPAVEPRLLVKLGAGIRRGERNLQTEHVQLAREVDRLLDGFARLDRAARE
jgi:hypothetical protein